MPARVNTLVGFNVATLLLPTDPGGAPLNGPSVSPSNTDGMMLCIVTAAVSSGSTTPKMQGSPNPGGPWTDIPGAVFPTISSTVTHTLTIERAIANRFLRLAFDGDPGGPIAAMLVAVKKQHP